jgi:hypothetical protein
MPDWQIALVAWHGLLLLIGLGQEIVKAPPTVTAAPPAECRTLEEATRVEIPCEPRGGEATK